ncbi:MAG TPA: branched-chain amino acid ABC transporter permease [Phototrophicaceae bacterium]|nr:branched-chain amino acid ABC transporter permease [Phototrophicaceae bacterium]
MTTQELLQQLINALSLGTIYALFALGYALIFSVLGVLNLAHSAVFTSGAVIGLLIVLYANLPPPLQLPLAFVGAMIGAGLLGVVLELVAFRPLRRRGAPRISQLISSIGAALLIVNITQLVFQNLFSTTEAYFPDGLIPTQTIQLGGGVSVQPIRLIILAVSLVLMVLLQYLVNRTRVGRQMRAVAFNERTSRLLGINVSRVYLLTFFIAGTLGGAGGLLYGLAFTRVTPFVGQDIALVGLTAIVLGGLGSIPGAVIGGFVVALLQTFSVVIGGSSYRDAVVFIAFFLILLLRPQGLLGHSDQSRA